MNSAPNPHASGVDEQAAYWAMRIDGGELADHERVTLERWLAAAPAHRTALAGYCQLSADLEESIPHLVATGAVAMPAVPPATAARRRTFSFGPFATLAAAAAVAVAVWWGWPQPEIQNVATAIAQRQTHTLPDGTRVELNAHTSLRFENANSERRVRLAGGEAIFAVAKDAERPFIVETRNGAVRVTGTQFNVRNDDAAGVLEVTVLEGSVLVRPAAPDGGTPPAPIALKAADQLLSRDGQVSVRNLPAAALADAVAWRQGRIVFDDVPLAEAAQRFAHYHGRSISVAPEIAHLRLGGRYTLEDFSGFLAGLEIALAVQVRYDLSGAVFITARHR